MQIDFSTIIVSIISSTVLSAIISGWIAWQKSKLDFRNDFLKSVISKRMNSYEKIEILLSSLKSSALDGEDGKAYHLVFANGNESFIKINSLMMLIQADSIWITEQTAFLIHKLSRIFTAIMFEYNVDNSDELILAGKKYYFEIGDLREEVENLARKDILKLYDINQLKSKKNFKGKFESIKIPKKNKH